MSRCEIDISEERRELNSRSYKKVDLGDEVENGEALFSMPNTLPVPNDAEEVFRKLNIALAKLNINIPGVNHG